MGRGRARVSSQADWEGRGYINVPDSLDMIADSLTGVRLDATLIGREDVGELGREVEMDSSISNAEDELNTSTHSSPQSQSDLLEASWSR